VIRTLTVVCCLVVAQQSRAASSDQPDFKALYDTHQWFALRDAVTKGDAPVFYQGAVACAFNKLSDCEKKMRAVIKANPRSDEAIKAHGHLASAYLIHGKNREALSQVQAILAVKPDREDAKNMRPLLAAFPDQVIEHSVSTTLDIQDSGLPFSINGKRATYWFDTGANFSLMSESEAKRFGLKIAAVPTRMGVSTGEQVDLKIAVADEVSFGAFRLRRVSFSSGPRRPASVQ
jgi:Aspartyl protease